jgi:ribonuclease D
MLINTPKELRFVRDQIAEAAEKFGSPLAFDTEFVSERRYSPRLCLLQVFSDSQPVPIQAALDPFAVDLAPLVELIADPSITKIVHAGSQDLQILWAQFGCRAQNVFDTQIAAAFLGYGHQAGYTELVRRVAQGPTLSKAQQFTDWSARPLSKQQVDYALDDVRYLPRVYEILQRELSSRGRSHWAQTEFERAMARSVEQTPPDELYRKFNLSGLSRRQLGHLRELAATREAIARRIDKPPSFVVPDLTLLQMAKLPPANVQELRGLRGMPGQSEENARELLSATQRVSKMTDDELPRLLYNERPDPQTEVVGGLLNVVTQLRADECEISRSYLAPRDQLNALAAWWLKNDGTEPPDLPLLHDWRHELLGEELMSLLQGRLAISLDGSSRGRASRGRSDEGASSVVQIVPTRRS